MKRIGTFTIIHLVSATALFAAKPSTSQSKYQNLIKPLDLFRVPVDVKTVMKMNELYEQISRRGVKIRIAKEDYSNALEKYSLTYDGYNLPKASLSASVKNSQSSLDAVSVTSNSNSYSLGVGITGDTGWGLSYSLGFPSLTQTSDVIYGTNSVTASLTLTSVSLALLRGSVFFLGRNAKNSADVTMSQSQNTLKSTVLSTIQNAESAFYDVLLKQIRVQVLEQGFQSSQALLSDIKEMVQAGESDRLSILKAELQVSQNETDLLQAKIELTNARQTLRDQIALRVDENLEIYPDPLELKANPVLPTLDPKELLERAKTTRPDYLNSILGRKTADLNVQTAYSNALPSLNLTYAHGYSGTGTSLSEAQLNLTRWGPPTSTLGIEFSYAFFNDSALSNYRQAKFSLDRADVQVEEAHNLMNKEINSAIIGIQMGARRLKSSELARQLSEKKLQSEFEKFRVGESSIRNITDYQNEVNQARISEINSRVEFFKSVSSLRTSVGDLPEGVKLSFTNY